MVDGMEVIRQQVRVAVALRRRCSLTTDIVDILPVIVGSHFGLRYAAREDLSYAERFSARWAVMNRFRIADGMRVDFASVALLVASSSLFGQVPSLPQLPPDSIENAVKAAYQREFGETIEHPAIYNNPQAVDCRGEGHLTTTAYLKTGSGATVLSMYMSRDGTTGRLQRSVTGFIGASWYDSGARCSRAVSRDRLGRHSWFVGGRSTADQRRPRGVREKPGLQRAGRRLRQYHEHRDRS